MSKQVIIIGAGPGDYVAAIRASRMECNENEVQ